MSQYELNEHYLHKILRDPQMVTLLEVLNYLILEILQKICSNVRLNKKRPCLMCTRKLVLHYAQICFSPLDQ